MKVTHRVFPTNHHAWRALLIPVFYGAERRDPEASMPALLTEPVIKHGPITHHCVRPHVFSLN